MAHNKARSRQVFKPSGLAFGREVAKKWQLRNHSPAHAWGMGGTSRPGTNHGVEQSNRGMILLDAHDGEHSFTGRDHHDIATQLVDLLDVQDDEQLAALAAVALRCQPLDVMITHTPV